MGLADQLKQLIGLLPEHRQTVLFSATLPKMLVEFAAAGLNNPELIRLDTDSKISEVPIPCMQRFGSARVIRSNSTDSIGCILSPFVGSRIVEPRDAVLHVSSEREERRLVVLSHAEDHARSAHDRLRIDPPSRRVHRRGTFASRSILLSRRCTNHHGEGLVDARRY